MSDHPTPLGGTCGARFDPLRELFAAKLESGEDLGASLAVNIDGEMVVDLWGGWADQARTVPWTEDAITCVFGRRLPHRPADLGVPSRRRRGDATGAVIRPDPARPQWRDVQDLHRPDQSGGMEPDRALA